MIKYHPDFCNFSPPVITAQFADFISHRITHSLEAGFHNLAISVSNPNTGTFGQAAMQRPAFK